MSIKNDGHYFCRAGGNRPDGLNEPVTNVAAGLIKVKPQAERFTGEGAIKFVDASQEKYDVIITCTGYEMPDYSFIRKRTA
ncbi:hypothetical protein [Escherichia coli]|uniref:hypothetical protein n=1 Tax=Escherichia coli TaxID=562 RepID=UPI003D766F4D